MKKGETLESLAQRFCEDKRRAPVLAQIIGLKPGEKVREGQEIVMPFEVQHRAEAPEAMSSVARTFYGDANKAKLLMDYNLRTSPMIAKGERVMVPIEHVKIGAVYLQPPRDSLLSPLRPRPSEPTAGRRRRSGHAGDGARGAAA